MYLTAVEILEPRIAPASVVVSYTDVDGDLVKIIAKKPGAIAAPLDVSDLVFTDGDTDGQLATLTISDPGFDNSTIAFRVIKKPGGDGLAHVGFIDATGVDLDQVIVKGDLHRISAGSAETRHDPGLNLLKARTMGKFGSVTDVADPESNASRIEGALGALRITGDIFDVGVFTTAQRAEDLSMGSVFIGGDVIHGKILCFGSMGNVRVNGDVIGTLYSNGTMGNVRIGGDLSGDASSGYRPHGSLHSNGAMGNVFIGGSIIGGPDIGSGKISSLDTIGNVRVSVDLFGGAGKFSGQINAVVSVGNVRIDGSVIGGTGIDSGAILSYGDVGNVRVGQSLIGKGERSGVIQSVGKMGNLRIGGDVIGGTGLHSGIVHSYGTLGDVRIGGSVFGGTGDVSGVISANRAVGNVFIAGDLKGGSNPGGGPMDYSGEILSNFGSIASVTIKGSIIAGSIEGEGTLDHSGAIVAAHDLGPIKIGGSILGNSRNPVLIMAHGQEIKPGGGVDTAIASITVAGDVRFAEILAGYNVVKNPTNADASIGNVTVGGDWAGSSLVAGAYDATLDGFGVGDALQTMGDTALIARIASIAIKGTVTNSANADDHFGFVAQQIDKLKVGSQTLSFTAGPGTDDLPLPFTNDTRVLEVA